MSNKTNYAVQINNQEEFDELMEYRNRIDWYTPRAEWWAFHCNVYGGDPLYFDFEKDFGFCYKKYYEKKGYTIITLSQAKEKIRHMKAYKEWRERQIKLPKAKDPKAKKITIKSSKQWLKDFINENKDEIKAYIQEMDLKCEANHNPAVVSEVNYPFGAMTGETPVAKIISEPSEDKIDYTKIKAGDKIRTDFIVAEVHPKCIECEVYDWEGIRRTFVLADKNSIKKHIPVKSALEEAEEEEHRIACEIWDQRVGMPYDVQDYLDRYYQARKTLEDLKGKN